MTLPRGESLKMFAPADRVARPGIAIHMPKALVEAGTILAFVAAILASNLALTNYPNVKLFDMLVFVAGYTLGFRRGAIVAAAAWIGYEAVNPFGPGGLALLVVKVGAEVGYALAGASAKRLISPGKVRALPSVASLLFGVLAVVSTLFYDAATNLYTAFHWAALAQSTDYIRWITATMFNPGALFFAAAHLSSNVLFFAAIAPFAIKAVQRLKK